MELRFYDVGRGRLARVLRSMLEKTLSRGERAVVRFSSKSRAAELDAYLWNEPIDGFLPHALADDILYASAESSSLQVEQPIILTTGVEVINDARVLFHWQEGDAGELAAEFPIRADQIGADKIGADKIGADKIGADQPFDLCCFLFSSGDGDGSETVAQELWARATALSVNAGDGEAGSGVSVNFWVASGGSWIKRKANNEVKHEQASEDATVNEDKAADDFSSDQQARTEDETRKDSTPSHPKNSPTSSPTTSRPDDTAHSDTVASDPTHSAPAASSPPTPPAPAPRQESLL